MLRRFAPVLLSRRSVCWGASRLSSGGAGASAAKPPDVAATAAVSRLFNVPREDRGDEWLEKFLHRIANASMEVGSKVTIGPDECYYFAMKLPDTSKPYPSYSLMTIFSHVLEQGAGVSVSSRDGEIQWVFSYGDLVNYHINGQFYSMHVAKDIPVGSVTLGSGAKLLVGNPSERYLPKIARHVLRSFLEANGIKNPKVALIVHEESEEGTAAVSELAFATQPGDELSNELIDMMRWFLPRHYLIVNVSTLLEGSSGEFRWSAL